MGSFQRDSRSAAPPDLAVRLGFLLLRDVLLRFWHIGNVLADVRAVADGHAHADQRLERALGVVDEVLVVIHAAGLEQDEQRAAAELEVAELLAAGDVLPGLPRDDRAADHHGADADDHDAAVADRVDRHEDAHVFAVDVERGADGHGVDRVVLAFDRLGGAEDAVDGDVEAVVVLRREPENTQRAAFVALDVFWVRITQQSLEREFPPFDPDLGSVVDAVKHDGAAVGRRHDDVGVVGSGARAGAGFQRAVEELVERLELFQREQHLGHVELVERDETGDLGGGRGVVVLFALLDAEGLEHAADWKSKSAHNFFYHYHQEEGAEPVLLFFSISRLFKPL